MIWFDILSSFMVASYVLSAWWYILIGKAKWFQENFLYGNTETFILQMEQVLKLICNLIYNKKI